MGWTGQVVRMGKMRNSHKLLVSKPECKRPLERPSQKQDSIKYVSKQIGYEGVDW